MVDLSDMTPQALPGKTSDLILAGATYPVTLKAVEKPDTLTLDLISHGEVLESERYGITGETFGLWDAAEEHFKPMLPLLKFPLHLGDSWDWTGCLATGGISKPAVAEISTESERIFTAGASHETVRTTVDISVDANPGKPQLKRQLIFWFEPKAGIITRQFGPSVRQPSQ
jgi:hypothetical protein